MESDLVRQRLREIPLFAELPDESLDLVAATAAEVEAPAGHVLAEAGHEGAGMFVLEEGTVAVELPDGRIKQLAPGDFFGELSLLGAGVRVARVRATSAVRCLAIARGDFEKLLQAEPHIARAMLPVVARRLAEVRADN